MKFSHNSIELKNGEKAVFGTNDDSYITFKDDQLQVSSTVSGITPTKGYHLTTKQYVDDVVSTVSGEINSMSFLELTDSPTTSYSGLEGMALIVNASGTGLEFSSVSFNVDGGLANSVYGGTTDADGGSASSIL